MDKLLKEWGVDDRYFVLTPERLEQMYNKRCKEEEDMTNFTKDNPYPSPNKIGKLIELMILDKYPEKALNDLYYRKVVEKCKTT